MITIPRLPKDHLRPRGKIIIRYLPLDKEETELAAPSRSYSFSVWSKGELVDLLLICHTTVVHMDDPKEGPQ